jgi:hypothetical protein
MRRMFKHIFCSIILVLFFLNVNAQEDTFEVQTPVVEPPAEYDQQSSTTTDDYYQFKENITPSKVDARKIPDKDLARTRSDDDYWYVNEAPPREKRQISEPKKGNNIFDKAWFQTLFWIILVGGFVALLIWFLATSNISLFRKKQKTPVEENIDEAETEDIFEMNFEKEIQKAIDAENYRMAVRLLYLRTLRDLSLRNLIRYTHEKTNSDYLFQLAGSSYYKNFFKLTRSFDYTWYGQFPLSKESFSLVQNDFITFKQQLS